MSNIRTTKPKKNIHPCHHVGIFVRDMEKTGDFYARKMGFCFEREYCVDKKIMNTIFGIHSDCRIRYLSRSGFRIELFDFTGKKLKRRGHDIFGLNHWALVVDDRVRFCAGLKRRGVPVIRIVKPSGEFTFFIKDPESNLIEIRDG